MSEVSEVSKQHVGLDNDSLPPEVLEYFKDRDKARRWLATPSPALGGQSPQDLSAEHFLELLNKLKYGMTA